MLTQRKDHFSKPQVVWAWLLSRFLHFRRKNSSLRSSSEKIAFMTFSVGLKHISKNWNHCRNPGLRKVFCFFQRCRKKQHKKPSEEDQKWFLNKVELTFFTNCKYQRSAENNLHNVQKVNWSLKISISPYCRQFLRELDNFNNNYTIIS